MVGIEVIPFSVRRFFGVDVSHPTLDLMALPVAVITLVVMTAIPGQFFFLYKQYDKFFFRRRFYGFVTLLE